MTRTLNTVMFVFVIVIFLIFALVDEEGVISALVEYDIYGLKPFKESSPWGFQECPYLLLYLAVHVHKRLWLRQRFSAEISYQLCHGIFGLRSS